MRKVIVYIAVSADGYIARLDGDVAWLDRPRTAGDYGMAAFYRSIDTTIMGRKTYEVGLKLGQAAYPGKKNYIFSRKRSRPTSDVEFVKGDIVDFVGRLRRAKGKDIWLVGGADLIGSFVDRGLVDEFIVHVIPTLIGEGIPLISSRWRSVQLALLSCKAFSDGVARLHYRVLQPGSAQRKKSPEGGLGRHGRRGTKQIV